MYFRENLNRLFKHIGETKTYAFHDHESHKRRTRQQHYCFNNLYPSGRQHATKHYVGHHQ